MSEEWEFAKKRSPSQMQTQERYGSQELSKEFQRAVRKDNKQYYNNCNDRNKHGKTRRKNQSYFKTKANQDTLRSPKNCSNGISLLQKSCPPGFLLLERGLHLE